MVGWLLGCLVGWSVGWLVGEMLPVVPKNCCQAFIFNSCKFARGPKTLEKMWSGVQFSMNEMLPVVPKKKQHIVDEASFFVFEILST